MDLDGLKREAYSLFWKQALEDYFEGSSTFVPRVSPEIDESTMGTLACIISHQYVLTGIFPVHINRAFIVATLCGRQAVSDEDLIEAFLEYISENESQESQSDQGELSGESCEFMLDFFSDYQVTKRPLASKLKATLVQVAKNELLSKPAMAMDGMREGLRDVSHNAAHATMCNAMLAEEPSTHLNKSRAKIFSYLKKYIRYLSRKELGRFLRYVTGSPVPVVKCIKVMFHVNELGSLPHPHTQTCAASIDFPDSGYASFNDFRIQMDSLPNNDLAWKFTSL